MNKRRKTNFPKNVPLLRKARSKIKKPKYLSLSTSMKLQPRRPHNPDAHDHDPPELSMADRMFAEAEGPTTLTGLLNGTVSTTTTSGVSYGGYEDDSAARLLVRTAMRRERDEGGVEEKWVSISEVVTAAAAEEEVSSRGGGGLLLKLDYEQVLNAWSGKGGPFCDEEADELPQTVPDVDQYGVVFGTPLWDVNNKGHWSVPENNFNAVNSGNYFQPVEQGWKIGIREASVQRYKEKRQNRLFAKRVRYEVRKLNAEKRPRIKGRFVRRCGD